MKYFFLKRTLLVALMATFSLSALADSRIRTETYSSDKVYSIYAQVGRVVLVQLEEDEHLDGQATALGMGDAEAWTMGVRGNNIVFKPRTEHPITNMVVVSNKRTYAFDLKIATKKHSPTYIIRFNYPDSIKQRQATLNAKQNRAFDALRESGVLHDNAMQHNMAYFGKGNKDLAPTSIYDNGRFTFMTFDNGRDMPAVYRVEADGSETLLNAHIENNTLVIHEVNKKLILRLGRSVLLIENRGFQAAGAFNRTGTDDNKSVRLIK